MEYKTGFESVLEAIYLDTMNDVELVAIYDRANIVQSNLWVIKRMVNNLKVRLDIEGLDILCKESLKNFKELPKYLFVETSGTNKFEEAFELISHLYVFGYKKFKLINPAENCKIKLPKPAKEGKYVDHVFSGFDNSGAFGEETEGEWKDVQAIISEHIGIHMSRSGGRKKF